jgi:hypothetical protein
MPFWLNKSADSGRIVGKPYLTGPNWITEGLPVNAPREANAISEMAPAQLVKRLQ